MNIFRVNWAKEILIAPQSPQNLQSWNLEKISFSLKNENQTYSKGVRTKLILVFLIEFHKVHDYINAVETIHGLFLHLSTFQMHA